MSSERLQQLKVEVKNWEYSFKKQNGRQPTKDDVKKNPEIEQKYKEYKRLKTPNPVTPKKRRSHAEASPRQENEENQDRSRDPEHDDDDADTLEVTGVGPTPQLHGRVMGLFDVIATTPIKDSPISSEGKEHKDDDQQCVQDTPTKTTIDTASTTPMKSIPPQSPCTVTPSYLNKRVTTFSPLAPRRVKRGLSSLIAEFREIKREASLGGDQEESTDQDAAVEIDHLGEEKVDPNNKDPFADDNVKTYRKRGQKRTTRRHIFKPVINEDDHDNDGNDNDDSNKVKQPAKPKKAKENYRRLKLNNSGFKGGRANKFRKRR